MWLTDLHKATTILLESGYTELLIKKVCAGGGEILAVFYTTHYTKLVVYKNGMIAEYEVE